MKAPQAAAAAAEEVDPPAAFAEAAAAAHPNLDKDEVSTLLLELL